MKRLLTIAAACVLSLNLLWAQSTVSGTVTDSNNGNPVEGVAVIVQGTTVGMFTNDQGRYSLQVPDGGSSLIFTFVGMKKLEVPISGRSVIDVSMEASALELDEVVVTAFGIEKEQRAITSAVQEVGGSALVNSRETNVVSALSGKVAGVQVTNTSGSPGAGSNIVIRGNASLTGSNQPLFVIDGVPVDNSQVTNLGETFDQLGDATWTNRAVDINPEDIAEISVLKGPAASALYGSRASNGVILITTKKGGSVDGGTHVSYSTSLSFDEVNKLPELNERYAQGFGGNLIGRTSVSWGPAISTLSYDGDPTSNWDRSGNLVLASAANATGEAARSYDRAEYFQIGRKWDNNVTLRGGDLDDNFILSVSNTDHTGVVPNSDFNRTSVRAGGQAKLGKKLTANSSLTYTYTRQTAIQQGSNVNGVMLGLLRTSPSFDNSFGLSDITGENNTTAYLNPDGTQRNYRGGGGYDNPYWVSYQNPMDGTVNRINGYASVSYKPLEWLNVTYRLGADTWSEFRKQRFGINASGGNAPGKLVEQQSRYFEVNSDLFVTATKQFTQDFGATLLLGSNLNHRFSQTVFAEGTGLTIPGFFNLSNASNFRALEDQDTRRIAGLFGDLQLEYKRMLYLNLTARNDWASTFGNNQNNFFYPSASLGFVFTEALGLSDGSILPFGKLRVSYAEAGKEPDPYLLSTVFIGGTAGGGFITGVSAPFLGQNLFTQSGLLGNPNILPEQTSSIEVGLDLRFLNGRLNIDATYYNQTSEGQIIGADIPGTTGFTRVILNAGKVENRGFEVVLDVTPIKTRSGFTWNIMTNFTRNESEVLELVDDLEFLAIGQNFGSAGTRAIVGEPYGLLFGPVYERTSDGQLIIDDATGHPLQAEESDILGDPNPDWLLGINNSFSYKGVTLSALLDIRQGGDLWNGTKGALYYFGAHKDTDDNRFNNTVKVFDGVLESSFREQETNPGAWVANDIAVPLDQSWHFSGPGSGFTGPTDQFIEDGSWVRLREVTLGYSLPKSLLDKTPFGNIDISFTGRNLWLHTDYSGIDPETSLKGVSNGAGFDYFNMPNTRSYVGALRMSF